MSNDGPIAKTSAFDIVAVAARIDAGMAERTKAFDAATGSGKGTSVPEPSPLGIYNLPEGDSPFEGSAAAPVTIVAAGEFACPYCAKSSVTLRELRGIYGDKIKIVHKSLIVHSQTALLPALAACAAHAQGAYSRYADALWTRAFPKHAFDATTMLTIAGEVGLDLPAFSAAIEGPECLRRLLADQQVLYSVGAAATPTFFINGHYVAGAQPVVTFQFVIDQMLAPPP